MLCGVWVTENGKVILVLYRILYFRTLQVAEAEEKTAGGLLLTEATKEKPSIGTVRIVATSAFFVLQISS